MSADAETMRYFPSVLTENESRVIADRCRALIESRGWGGLGGRKQSEQRVHRLDRFACSIG
ncbi:hypothetical protein [Comamonas jiangduensis]|uniref:hypothetical protein n=1 Tax=Comamonas jiangduensis TaxID=1194168 RepID=UPI0032AEA800